MSPIVSIVIAYIGGFLSLGVIFTALAIFFTTHPDQFEKWVGMIFGFISRFYEGAKYLAGRGQIQGKINSFVNDLESKTTANFPYISIRWAAVDNKELIYEDGEAIIVMKNREYSNKNLAHAAYFFISQALLKNSKQHLSKTQKTSIDLYATKKVLENQSAAAVEQFMSDYLIPHVDQQQEIGKFIKKYIRIDDIGVFFPILVEELSSLGSKVFLDKPTANLIEEARLLIDFLERFSNRRVGDFTPDEFFGRYVKCAVKVVAKREAREQGDMIRYKEAIRRDVREGFENIYLIGSANPENKVFVNQIVADILSERPELVLVRNYEFPGTIRREDGEFKVKTYLVHLSNPPAVQHIRV